MAVKLCVPVVLHRASAGQTVFIHGALTLHTHYDTLQRMLLLFLDQVAD